MVDNYIFSDLIDVIAHVEFSKLTLNLVTILAHQAGNLTTMFLVKFCKVVALETYVTGNQLLEITQYHYASIKSTLKAIERKKTLEKKMQNANSYSEWKICAEEYDQFTGKLLLQIALLSFN